MAHTLAFRRLIQLLQQARRDNLRAAGRPDPVPAAPGGRRLTRRRLLTSGGAIAVGGAGVGLAEGWPGAAGAWLDETAERPRVAVVGAGIAGLSAAWHLQQQGVPATVFEAGNRVGGRMLSAEDVVADGVVVDFGGSYINTDHADLIALAETVGVRLVNLPAVLERLALRRSAYYYGGADVAEADLAARLRPLAAQIAADSDRLDTDWDTAAPALDRLSVADYLDRHQDKMRDPVVHPLIRSMIRSEYGVEPDQCSALQLLWLLPVVDGHSVELLGTSDEAFMVEGGTETIARGLAARLGDRVHLNKRLLGLREEGDRHRLFFADGSVVEADATILALPQAALRSLDLAIALPADHRAFIEGVSCGRNEKAFAGFTGRPWRQPTGFATEGWTDLGADVVWDEAIRQPGHPDGVLTVFHGGDETWALEDFGAEGAARRVLDGLDRHIEGLSAAANGRFARSVWTRTPGLFGAYTSLEPGQYTRFETVFAWEGETPADNHYSHAGRLVFAGEQFSDAYYGFMNGGAETGRLAATLVAQSLQAIP